MNKPIKSASKYMLANMIVQNMINDTNASKTLMLR